MQQVMIWDIVEVKLFKCADTDIKKQQKLKNLLISKNTKLADNWKDYSFQIEMNKIEIAKLDELFKLAYPNRKIIKY